MDKEQTTALVRKPRTGPQIQEITEETCNDPVDDPDDEMRESLHSLKLSIKTLGHKKLTALAASKIIISIGMQCESLLAGARLSHLEIFLGVDQ